MSKFFLINVEIRQTYLIFATNYTIYLKKLYEIIMIFEMLKKKQFELFNINIREQSNRY